MVQTAGGVAVMVTLRPDVLVAATLKLVEKPAVDGAAVVTEIV
jgi:hypothetical protein